MELLVNEIQEEQSTTRGDYYSLALFRDEDAIGLEFQRGVGGIYGQPENGTPPYCIVTSDQRTFYGGVQRVTWAGSSVEMDLSEEACAVLRCSDRRLVLSLELSTDDLARVKDGLKRIFSGDDSGGFRTELIGFGD